MEEASHKVGFINSCVLKSSYRILQQSSGKTVLSVSDQTYRLLKLDIEARFCFYCCFLLSGLTLVMVVGKIILCLIRLIFINFCFMCFVCIVQKRQSV